jgi:hypothetical protein
MPPLPATVAAAAVGRWMISLASVHGRKPEGTKISTSPAAVWMLRRHRERPSRLPSVDCRLSNALPVPGSPRHVLDIAIAGSAIVVLRFGRGLVAGANRTNRSLGSVPPPGGMNARSPANRYRRNYPAIGRNADRQTGDRSPGRMTAGSSRVASNWSRGTFARQPPRS